MPEEDWDPEPSKARELQKQTKAYQSQPREISCSRALLPTELEGTITHRHESLECGTKWKEGEN